MTAKRATVEPSEVEPSDTQPEPRRGGFRVAAPYWVLLACSIFLAVLKVEAGLDLAWGIVLLPVILVTATAALVALTAFFVAGVAGVQAFLRRR
ncbi:MAG: hypothetical protein ACYC2H_01960 [Thermoplasmatota archaeon]